MLETSIFAQHMHHVRIGASPRDKDLRRERASEIKNTCLKGLGELHDLPSAHA